MYECLRHSATFGCGTIAVVLFRNVFGDQDRVLAYGAHAVRQLLGSIEIHAVLLSFVFAHFDCLTGSRPESARIEIVGAWEAAPSSGQPPPRDLYKATRESSLERRVAASVFSAGKSCCSASST